MNRPHSPPAPGLRHLEVFHWVMTTGSVAGAARAMRSSQPAISRDLARFQQLLGHPLFERAGRRLRPTPAAIEIHDELRRNYRSVEAVIDLSRRILAGSGGRLRIGSVPSIALAVVPRAIGALAARHARASFDLQVHSRDTLTAMVRDHRVDVAFSVLGARTDGIVARHLATIETVCVVHRDSPLARRHRITPADLAGQPFIALAPDYLSRQRIDETFVRAGIEPRTFMTTQTAASACGLVAGGYGAAVIDAFTASAFAGDALRIRPFVPAVMIDYVVMLPPGEHRTPMAAALIDGVRDVMTAQGLGQRGPP